MFIRFAALAVSVFTLQAQTPAAPPARDPLLGASSTRLEDWGKIRTAAAPVLGWRVGIAGDSFRRLTFYEAVEKVDTLGLPNIEGSSSQKVSFEIPKSLDYHLAPGEIVAVKERLRAFNIRMPAYTLPAIGPDETATRKLFEFAKGLSVETLVSSAAPETVGFIDKLANEYGINVALSARSWKDAGAENRSPRIGVCLDPGQTPAGGLAALKGRPVVIRLRKDSSGFTGAAKEFYALDLKPSLIVVAASGDGGVSAELARSLESLEKALYPLVADRVNQISRTAAIRTPDRLPAEDLSRIDAALPREAPARPKRARKLLVLDLNVAYPGHRSIPAENYALEQMGKRTGAYEAVFDNNLDNLKYDRIKQFDAVFLNNTVGMIYVDPEVRDGMARFVREGGGLAGNHGTSHASMDWPGFGELIGTRHGIHREATEQATIKIDDPASPLNASFGGKEFVYQDEFFRFPTGPYSREKQHVLLSIDVPKTDMYQGRACARPCVRADYDYAVSWIHNYGKGRVFFSILGHNPTLFTTPALAAHFLAGIQFILGDLEADATPSAKTIAKKP